MSSPVSARTQVSGIGMLNLDFAGLEMAPGKNWNDKQTPTCGEGRP